MDNSEQETSHFFQTYFQDRFDIGFSEAIFNYVKSGYLDTEKLREEINPPSPTSGEILLSELKEQRWFFSNDAQNMQYVEAVIGILKERSEAAQVGFELGIQMIRVCSHSSIPSPTEFDDIFKSFLEEQVKHTDRTKTDLFHSRSQDEVEFKKKWVPIFQEISDKDAARFWREWFKGMILNGEEINTYDSNIRGEEVLAIALTNEDLLTALDGIRSKHPDVHYNFFIRARRQMDESPIEERKKNMYLKILKERISEWVTTDNSETYRKNFLLSEFYNDIA